VIEVVRVGLLATIQDLGRPGWAHLGVPRSGALDAPSLLRANRLVGNRDGAAGIEATLRGITVRALAPAVIAVAGARCEVSVDGEPAGFEQAIAVGVGAEVVIGRAVEGMRAYVAVAGGLDVPAVLGSRATDSLSGLGPAPLQPGDRIPVGAMRGGIPRGDALDAPTPLLSQATLRLWPGPRDTWFREDAMRLLTSSAYQLSPLSNRVGARLSGPSLTRANAAELPSEPVVLGAVQVLADGQPVVFLADHPTTGGYPVIGVVDDRDIPLLGQMKPGGVVRFVAAS
jgi:biotin-dependent carboxylase-like uncharacterized protein